MPLEHSGRVVARLGPPLVLLTLVTAIAPASLHILVPALPMLAVVFDASPGTVQLVLTLFLAGIGVGQLVHGPASDRFGRRPVLLGGLSLFLVGTVLCGFAWSLPALIVGRALAALGGCAGMVLGRAIVRDVYDRERSASALATIGTLSVTGYRCLPCTMGRVARRFRPARHDRRGCPGADGGQPPRGSYARIRQRRRHDRGVRPAAAVPSLPHCCVRYGVHQRFMVHLFGGGTSPACRTAARANEHLRGRRARGRQRCRDHVLRWRD